ncbi:MAG: hypothetical protein ACC656_11940, partial [Candidatus Heimdallarchaeota archaeon]
MNRPLLIIMVSITSTRGSSTTAILLLTGYMFIVTQEFFEGLITSDVELIFLLTVGTFIAIA